jgi:PhnB protein
MKKAKAIPENYHSLMIYLNLTDAGKAIDYYEKAFGAREIDRIVTPDGKVLHAELQIDDSRFMLSEEMPERGNKKSNVPERHVGNDLPVCRGCGLCV